MTTILLNNATAECVSCGEVVLRGTGLAPREGCYCQACYQRESRIVRLWVASETLGHVGIRPKVELDSVHFRDYLDTVFRAGARFDRGSHSMWITIDAMLPLIDALKARRWTPVGTKELFTLLQVRSVAKLNASSDAMARVDAIEARTGWEWLPFQRLGISWLVQRARGGLLCDEMGLGKTSEVLGAIPDGVPVLIVCPKVARGVWERELSRVRPDISARPVRKATDGFAWPGVAEAVICSYDLLRFVIEFPLSTPQPETVLVLDEAQYVSHRGAERTIIVEYLAHCVRYARGKVFAVTGTPMLGKPPELAKLCKIAGCFEEAFGSWEEFVRLFRGKERIINGKRHGYFWGLPSESVGPRLARVMLRRTKSEVLKELPSKRRETIVVDIDDEDALAAMDAALNAILEAVRAETGRDVDVSAAALWLTEHSGKIPGIEGISQAMTKLSLAKLPHVLELVEHLESVGGSLPFVNCPSVLSEPVLVFSAHRTVIDALGARKGWKAITGSVSAKKRKAIEEEFQGGKYKGLALTIQAGGVALTLTRASRVVIVDPSWTPAENLQAEDRSHRYGQSRGVLVTYLVADHPLEKHLAKVLMLKLARIDASVGAAEVLGDTDATQAHHAKVKRALEKAIPKSAPREAETDAEKRAAQVLETLFHAESGGFSRVDEDEGTSLATYLRLYGKLTERQWVSAVAIAKRYEGQVAQMLCNRM